MCVCACIYTYIHTTYRIINISYLSRSLFHPVPVLHASLLPTFPATASPPPAPPRRATRAADPSGPTHGEPADRPATT